MTDFIDTVWDFYEKNRRSFPWRETYDPYEILVSEIMLQQTQTHRVLPKYLSWLQPFPSVAELAAAPLSDVLIAWSGLGYNRRAKFLWEAAKKIVYEFKGGVPREYAELRQLPGIGEYTANALLAFAYNESTVVLETNIRTALLHHFFKDQDKISEKEFKAKLAEIVPNITKRRNRTKLHDTRNWYYALMDYGNSLKASGFDYFHKQKRYTKQSKFKGSDRFVRGWILKELTGKATSLDLRKINIPGYTKNQITAIAKAMTNEGLLKKQENSLLLP